MMRLKTTKPNIILALGIVSSLALTQSAIGQEPATSAIILIAKMKADGDCGSEPYTACLGFLNKQDCVSEINSTLDSCVASIGSPEILNSADSESLSQCFVNEFGKSPFLSKLEHCKGKLGNVSRGRELSRVCAACHGVDGNSSIERNPSIAGLKESYLVGAMQEYQTGIRTNAIMSGFTRALTEKDIRDLAAYYSNQKRKKQNNSVATKKDSAPSRKSQTQGSNVETCRLCHDKGVANAPRTGDTDAWEKLREKGFDALLFSVTNGKGLMPARGGTNFTDEQLKNALEELAGF